jgi:hypothetical protein
MSEQKPAIILQFDRQNYQPENFYELEKHFESVANVKVKELIRESLLPEALIVVLILVPLFYFQKGFFSKLGEKLGEAIGDDAVKAYESLKKEIIQVVQDTKSGEMPVVEFRFAINGTEISGFAKSSDEEVISRAFDKVEELFHVVEEYIREQNLQLKTFVFNLNVESMTWTPTYYITAKNEAYRFDTKT